MILTKLQGMKGKLLTEIDYKNLQNSNDDFCKVLARHSSYSYLKMSNKISLQNQISISLIKDINKISLVKPNLPTLYIYKLKSQIQIIKIYYTMLGEPIDFTVEEKVALKCLDIGMLQDATNKTDFLEALSGTKFYGILKSVKFSDYPFYLDLYFYKQFENNKYLRKMANQEIYQLNKQISSSVSKYTDDISGYLIPSDVSRVKNTSSFKNIKKDPIFSLAHYIKLKEEEIKKLIRMLDKK